MLLTVFKGTHTLQYVYTAVSHSGSTEFTAVGLLNQQQFMSFSSTGLLIIKDYINKTEDEMYWKNEEQEMLGNQDTFNIRFTAVREQLNHSGGKSALFWLLNCIGCGTYSTCTWENISDLL